MLSERTLLEKLALLNASRVRRTILKILFRKGWASPKEISIDAGSHFSTISRELQRLKLEGLIEEISPSNTKGKVYRLSALGRRACEVMREE